MMNCADKRSKSTVGRSTVPPLQGLDRLKWLNLKSLPKPKLSPTLNKMRSLSKGFHNNFPDHQYYDENQNLIGKKEVSSSGGADAVEKSTKIPKGSLAVYVGPELHRFVIPARCLSMPDITALMDGAAEEFGYDHRGGGIQLPNCDQHHFQDILAKCSKRHQTSPK